MRGLMLHRAGDDASLCCCHRQLISVTAPPTSSAAASASMIGSAAPYHGEHGHWSGPGGAGMGARRALLPRRTWGDTLRTRFVHSALRTLGRAPAPQAHSCQLTRQPLAQTSSRRAGGRSSSSGTGLSPAVPSSTTSSPTRCSFETPGTLLLCVWLRAAMLYVAGSGPSALLI